MLMIGQNQHQSSYSEETKHILKIVTSIQVLQDLSEKLKCRLNITLHNR